MCVCVCVCVTEGNQRSLRIIGVPSEGYSRMQIRSVITWASLFCIEKCNFRFERERHGRSASVSFQGHTLNAVAWLESGEDDRTACILRDAVDGISHFEVIYCLAFVHK